MCFEELIVFIKYFDFIEEQLDILLNYASMLLKAVLELKRDATLAAACSDAVAHVFTVPGGRPPNRWCERKQRLSPGEDVRPFVSQQPSAIHNACWVMRRGYFGETPFAEINRTNNEQLMFKPELITGDNKWKQREEVLQIGLMI